MFSYDPLHSEALLSASPLLLFLNDTASLPLATRPMPWGHQRNPLRGKHAPTFWLPLPGRGRRIRRSQPQKTASSAGCESHLLHGPSTQPHRVDLGLPTLSCLLWGGDTTLKLTVSRGAASGGRKQQDLLRGQVREGAFQRRKLFKKPRLGWYQNRE